MADHEKVTIRLYTGDKDWLSAMFPNIGYNKVIRELVHKFRRGVEEKSNHQQTANIPEGNVEIDIGALDNDAD